MQMKNQQAKSQMNTAGQRDGSNILYNVKPGRAYLVQKEDVLNLTQEERKQRADEIMGEHDVSITKNVKRKSKKRSPLRAYAVSFLKHSPLLCRLERTLPQVGFSRS